MKTGIYYSAEFDDLLLVAANLGDQLFLGSLYIDYNNSKDLQLLDNLSVRATLGDYLSWLYGGPVGAVLYGFYNAYFYNH